MVRTHVVVGGGSSGLALVKRLLEKDNVILIERGPVDSTSTPAPDATLIEKLLNIFPPLSIWCNRAFVLPLSVRPLIEEQRNLMGRQIPYAQGFGGGGSGGVNAMIYTLGNSLVYDQQWPKKWSATRVLQALEQILKYYAPHVVKSSGNLEVIIRAKDNLSDNQKELPATIMDNKGSAASYYTSINEDGTGRINQAYYCLGSSGEETVGKLTILPDCQVKKVLFKGREAISVSIMQRENGTNVEKIVSPENGGEIVLCAGVFETPRILISSGLKRVDPRTEMPLSTEYDSAADCVGGIEEKTDTSPLPNLLDIGENLQDHIVLPYMLIGNWYANWKHVHGVNIPDYGGKAAYPLNGVHGWVNLTKEGDVWSDQCTEPPRVQLLFIDGRVAAGIIPMMLPRFKAQGLYSTYIYPPLFAFLQYATSFAVVRWLCGYFFGILVCLTQPRSRGHLSVNPSNPHGPMRIDPNYLSHPEDLKALYNGFQTARQLVHTACTQSRTPQQQCPVPLRCVEVFPGPLFGYAANLQAFTIFAKLLSNTYFHACGTCAMANGAKKSHNKEAEGCVNAVQGGGVVDEEFRVIGVKKLRVVDASVIPAIPSSPTQALCMVMGEVCGQLILERQ